MTTRKDMSTQERLTAALADLDEMRAERDEAGGVAMALSRQLANVRRNAFDDCGEYINDVTWFEMCADD